ncbi:MAG: hypothetical protein ACYCSW_11110 [bacterium]
MNKKVVVNYIFKKFKIKDIHDNKKIFSIEDVLILSNDVIFVRKLIQHLPKKKRTMFIDSAFLSKVERFVYSTFYNFYRQKKHEESENMEFKGKMTAKIIKNYLKTYYSDYRFSKNTNKMINKMRHKAYYDVFIKN